MPKRFPVWAAAMLLAEAVGLAYFLALVRQSPAYTILDHGLRLNKGPILPFLGLVGAVFGALALVSISLARREAELFDSPSSPARGAEPGAFGDRLKAVVLSTTPLFALLLSPLLLSDYLDRGDLRTRLAIFAVLVFLAAAYLKIVERAALKPKRTPTLKAALGRFLGLPLKRRIFVMGLAAFVLYGACALLLVREGITFSGDEPNYLLTTHSLAYDGDINLANNYAHKDYFHFYSEKADPRMRLGIYAREGKKGKGYIYPINLPGISALMVPFYALAQPFGDSLWRTFILKGSLIIWAVLLGLQLYLLARDLWKREGLALGLWGLYAFSAPVLFYAIHIYPELPIALFSVYIYRIVRSGRRLRRPHLLGLGVLLGSFFWFGLKYNFIFWPLLAVSVYYLLKTQKPRAKVLWMVVPALLGVGVFYYAVWTMYGSLSPFAVYEGVITAKQSQAITKEFLALPHIARVETFLDYFLDQRDGLLLYAPFYAFMFLGLIEMFKRARKELLGLLLIAAPFVLNYAFFTHRQGFCPQGRVLAPVSWVGAVAVGYFLAAQGRRIFKWLFGLAAAAGFFVSGVLLAYPLFLYQPTTHDYTQRAGELFVFLGNIKLFLPQYLPSFIKVDNSGYAPNYFWVAALVLFIAAYALFGRKPGQPLRRGFHFAAAGLLLAATFFAWVLHPRTVLYPSMPVHYTSGETLGFYGMPMGAGVIAKDDGAMYLHFAKPYRFLFSSKEPLKRIRLRLGSEKGVFAAKLWIFDRPLNVVQTGRETNLSMFAPDASYRWRGLYVYEIAVSLSHLSDENMLQAPYLLQIEPWNRAR